MFRIGGSAEGITSGLSRQGYAHEPGHVKQDDISKTRVSDIGNLSIEQLQELTKAPGPDINDFLMNFGLDLVSRPKSGNILQQAATSATGPFKEFLTGKREADILGADRFKTLLEAQAKIEAGKGEGGGWLKQWEFEQIPMLHDKIAGLEKSIGSGELEGDALEQAQRDLISAEDQLNEIVDLDDMTKAWLKSDEGARFIHGIRTELWNNGDSDYTSEEDPNLGLDALTESIKRLKKRRRGGATGGRVGYANAGAVMPGAMPMNQAAGPTDQGPAPEDTAGITYEELRARLPQEVSDDIVRLLANSAEALEDFAMIQTEQDINNFNRKYGVTLVLPAEG